MGDDADAADALRGPERGPEGEQQQRGGVPLPLMRSVDRQLPEQGRGYRVRLVALLRLRQEGAFDLRCAQRDIADDLAARDVGDHIDA